MTNILLVDDDAIIRRTLKSRIDWEERGWDLVFTARDAGEAMDYLKNHEVQIIITDISMPGMNGIEMAQMAQNYYPLIKFIFISGYKDFEYAKQVLKLNAIDYLTKPLVTNDLISAVEKAELAWSQEQRASFIISEKYPQIKRKYISRMLSENFQRVDDSFFSTFDINLNTGLGIVGFAELDYDQQAPYDLMQKQISDVCTILNHKHPGSLFFCMDNLRIFLIFTCPDVDSEEDFQLQVKSLKEEIRSLSQTELGGSDTILYFGTVMSNLNELYGSYQTALQSMNNNTERLLEEVRRYISEHYGDSDLSLIAIADHFHLNHCYLTSIFKKKFNTNLYDYLIQMRMEKAARLILTTNMKSYEIANATGYKNPQYFSLSFKKYFGCTMTQYKNQHKEK